MLEAYFSRETFVVCRLAAMSCAAAPRATRLAVLANQRVVLDDPRLLAGSRAAGPPDSNRVFRGANRKTSPLNLPPPPPSLSVESEDLLNH